MKIDSIAPFWPFCQKILPLVYDNSLSYYECLCKTLAKLNEVIHMTNSIPEYIQKLVSDEKLKEILSGLLDDLRDQIAAANEGESKTATADRVKDELVWLNGDLYRVTRAMLAGDQYVTGSNCVKTTIEAEMDDVRGGLDAVKQDLNDGLAEAYKSIAATDAKVTTLSGNITTEANTRETEDTKLQNQIDKLSGDIGVQDYRPVINVTNHGIKADGETDNSDAFAELIKDGGDFFFPDGVYLFSKPITISAQYTRIHGAGRASVLRFAGDGIVVDAFYVTVSGLTFETTKQGCKGVTLLKSYATFSDLYFYDIATGYFNNFIIGKPGVPVWFSYFNRITINDTNVATKVGTAFDMTSTVNNMFTDVIIHAKNIAFNFNKDNTAGFSTDGCQLENINVTLCNTGAIIDSCSAIYFTNTIFDQITDLVFNAVSAKHCTFDSCYMSASTSSAADFTIGRFTNVDTFTINNSECAGNLSDYGFVLSGSSNINILNSSIGHTKNAITISDAATHDCTFYNLDFDQHVQTKLYTQGEHNVYYGFTGSGVITVAGATSIQSVAMFSANSSQVTVANQQYVDIDIPLPAGVAKPFTMFFCINNADAFYTWTYLYAQSPEGSVRVRVRRCDNTAFSETLTYSYLIPLME